VQTHDLQIGWHHSHSGFPEQTRLCGLSLSSTGVPTPRRSTETKHIDQSQDAEDAAFGPEDAYPAAAEYEKRKNG
jgi:hypothetical protein